MKSKSQKERASKLVDDCIQLSFEMRAMSDRCGVFAAELGRENDPRDRALQEFLIKIGVQMHNVHGKAVKHLFRLAAKNL